MRIALITDGIWPYVLGGMQKHSYYVCKYLARNKIQVHLFHFNQSAYDISKLEYFTADEKKYITSILVPFPTGFSFPGHYLRKSYKYSRAVYELLRDKIPTYDFIYTKGFTGWYLLNREGARKVPVGVNFHGYEMFQTSPGLKIKLQHITLLRNPVKSIVKKADVVFSYGGNITNIIRSLGIDKHKIFELPSGVEKEHVAREIRTTGQSIKFVFLGRYERRKGIEELNEAIKMLVGDGQQIGATFHFIGPIPEDKRIINAVTFYHGEIRDKTALQKLLETCDVLLCPSWSEGMPNVILEAFSQGVTVMATDVGATNILVNEETGWLITEPDPGLIHQTMIEIINAGHAELDKKKQNALRLVNSKFIWEKLIDALIKKMATAEVLR
jgi:glycosyltransferase involved in cell wall biosynthesis